MKGRTIGLCHVDGAANLALMKLSAWHKAQGDRIIFPYDPMSIFAEKVDKAYGAVVFTKNRERAAVLERYGVEIGGTGWDLKKRLPPEIEAMKPDYSLYGLLNGVGFTSRGCIRRCGFCVVWRKEGVKIRHVCMPGDLVNPLSKKAEIDLDLMDNNALADPLWEEKFNDIIERRLRVDYTQGLDFRKLTPEKARYLRRMRMPNGVRFAYDSPHLSPIVREGAAILKDAGFNDYRLKTVYVLVNYNTTLEQDLARIYEVLELGMMPFVMVYDKENAPPVIKRLARWADKRYVLMSCRFEDYIG